MTSAFMEGMVARHGGGSIVDNPYRVPEDRPCCAGRRSISGEILARLHEAWENGWHFEGLRSKAPSDKIIIL